MRTTRASRATTSRSTAATSRRIAIRVKPGAKSEGVGGTWGDDGPLNVVLRARAVDGAANRQALRLLATVLGVRPRQLSIVKGAKDRTKVVEVIDPPDDLDERLDRWRNR